MAHPARLQQLHLRSDFISASPRLKWLKSTTHRAVSSLKELTRAPSLCLKLCPTLCCFCLRTPSLLQRAATPRLLEPSSGKQHPHMQADRRPRTVNCVTPGTSGALPLFLTAHRKYPDLSKIKEKITDRTCREKNVVWILLANN